MTRLFGTDGVRGVANAALTPELALQLSAAAAAVLGKADPHSTDRPVAVVGRDPRASGEMLEAAVVAGLTSTGTDVLLVGVLPTPAVAHLTAALDANLGVMISASHNAMPDNGIKFFAAGGNKLTDDLEDRIEDVVNSRSWPTPVGAEIGRVEYATDAAARYLAHLAAANPTRLDGLTVVVDCANGAASSVGPQALADAGARVIDINADPTGLNINDKCGSTHLETLIERVRSENADAGIAFDGDADRCLAVDATGAPVDGDAIMAILAVRMRDAGTLVENTLVATVMSNLGLHIAMRAAGIAVRTTGVGDRYVLEELISGGFSLGGEQSGHIVLPGHGTTGDGVLTALQLLGCMAETNKSLADLASIVTTLPQVLINVRVNDKAAVANSSAVQKAVTTAERSLGDTGRILLRPSGTEQLVRVMVEASDTETARSIAEGLAAVVAAS